MSDSTFEFVVVGGGTAGCVIASRLSQYLPPDSVCLIEAGPNDPESEHTTALARLGDLYQSNLVKYYSTTPQQYVDNRVMPAMTGRIVGGSSAVNQGGWMRASKADYDLVASRAGHDRFTLEKLMPYFKRTESYWDRDADSEVHGYDGPLQTMNGHNFPLCNTIDQTHLNLGNKRLKEEYAGEVLGLRSVVRTFRVTSESSSIRQHAGLVYDLSKVTVIANAVANRVRFEEPSMGGSAKATAVQTLSGQTLIARKEIIICCGAHRSPQLLINSGIGPPTELAKTEAAHVYENDAVGKNLLDHIAAYLPFRLRHPEKGFALPFTGKFKPEYARTAPAGSACMVRIPPGELRAIVQQDPNASTSDFDAHPIALLGRPHSMQTPIYAPITLNDAPYPQLNNIMAGTHITLATMIATPLSRGSVTINLSDPYGDPIIDPAFLSNPADVALARSAVRYGLRLMSTPPLAKEVVGEEPPEGEVPLTVDSSDEEIDARVRKCLQTFWHPMGSCALGKVVDAEFKVTGVEGLRVCDASVFPESLATLPQATVYAFGELCADLLKEEYGLEQGA